MIRIITDDGVMWVDRLMIHPTGTMTYEEGDDAYELELEDGVVIIDGGDEE